MTVPMTVWPATAPTGAAPACPPPGQTVREPLMPGDLCPSCGTPIRTDTGECKCSD